MSIYFIKKAKEADVDGSRRVEQTGSGFMKYFLLKLESSCDLEPSLSKINPP